MNDADVSKQIQQMVRFIRQEAEEKANEISVSAEEVSLLASQFKIKWLFYNYFLGFICFTSDSRLTVRNSFVVFSLFYLFIYFVTDLVFVNFF